MAFQKGNTYGDINQKDNRIGERKYNNDGSLMEIIEYINRENIYVKFIDYPYIKKSKYIQWKRGAILNPYYPKYYGVGYIGETTVNKAKNEHFKSYTVWKSLLKRCYGNLTRSNKSYQNCFVCDEWLCYANFKKWYEEKYYDLPNNEQLNIDKDIIINNNNIYSPNTCILVPKAINELFKFKTNCGIQFKNNRYLVFMHHNYYGSYKTLEEANKVNNLVRTDYLHEKVKKYKSYMPKDVYDFLINYQYTYEVIL